MDRVYASEKGFRQRETASNQALWRSLSAGNVSPGACVARWEAHAEAIAERRTTPSVTSRPPVGRALLHLRRALGAAVIRIGSRIHGAAHPALPALPVEAGR